MSGLRWLSGYVVWGMLGLHLAEGVIIAEGDGRGNTNAPPDDPGWANVGGGWATDIYLGKAWVLTARHVAPPSKVYFSGIAYDYVTNSMVSITNADGSPVDMAMIRITPTPPLPPLVIATSTPPVGTAVWMAGNGLNRSTNMIYWTATWQETNAEHATYKGFYWSAGSAKRWGTNTVYATNALIGESGRTSMCFRTRFDESDGSEAQGASGDSGGAVMYKADGVWQLAGVMVTIDIFSGQPITNAVFGNETYAVDVAHYSRQIRDAMAMSMTGTYDMTNGVIRLFADNLNIQKTNILRRATSLVENDWTNVAEFVLTTNSSIFLEDDVAGADGDLLFYRMVEKGD